MKLTFEEQAYHDEFVKVYNRYGDKIPDNEWLRLSTLREGLNVGFQQSRKIIEIVELEPYEKKYFEQHPEKQLSKVIVNVTTDTIVSQHDSIKEKRKHDISDFKNKKKKLEEDLNIKENLKAPEKVENPGELNFFSILLTYGIGAYMVWGLDWFWVGVILLAIESLIVFEKYCHISKYKKYKVDLNEYHSTKERLKRDIPQLKMEIGYLNTIISENLYSEINGGCSIPIPRKAINENTWEEMDGKLDNLVTSYSQYKDASETGSLKKEKSRNFLIRNWSFSIMCLLETRLDAKFTRNLQNNYIRQFRQWISICFVWILTKKHCWFQRNMIFQQKSRAIRV